VRRILLTLVLACGWAGAQREIWNPISAPYLPPLGEKPLEHACQLRLGAALANYLTYDSGDWGEIGADLEELRLTPGLYQGTPWGEFGVQVPFMLYYGGVLDSILNPIHQALGQPHSPSPPRTLLYLRDEAGNQRGIDSPAMGIGDPVLIWGRLASDGVWGRLSLALPLGDPGRFLGSGGFRFALSLGWESEFWGLTGQLVVPFGQQPVFRSFGTRPSVGGRFWTGLPWGLPGRLELQASTSPMVVGGHFASTTVALRYVWDGFSFSEDLTAGLPDVVFAAERGWPCPW
jgi:hypothetical protein